MRSVGSVGVALAGLIVVGAIAAYRQDGRFPDGTVLVKEVFKTTTQDMTTGPSAAPVRSRAGSSW